MAVKESNALDESWKRNEAQIDLDIRKRIYPTKDGTSSLHYFDGATMNKYKYPTRAMEVVFCRNPEFPQSCSTSQAFRPADSGASVSDFDLLDFKANVCPPLDSPEMKLLRLEGIIQSIFVQPLSEGIFSEIGNIICGSKECSIRALRSARETLGIGGPTVSYCLGSNALFVSMRMPFMKRSPRLLFACQFQREHLFQHIRR